MRKKEYRPMRWSRTEKRHDLIARFPVVALCWYRREDWTRILEICADREELSGGDGTFDEWEAAALGVVQDIEAMGRKVERIIVDPEELLAWCNSQGVPVDGSSRADYAGLVLGRKLIEH